MHGCEEKRLPILPNDASTICRQVWRQAFSALEELMRSPLLCDAVVEAKAAPAPRQATGLLHTAVH